MTPSQVYSPNIASIKHPPFPSLHQCHKSVVSRIVPQMCANTFRVAIIPHHLLLAPCRSYPNAVREVHGAPQFLVFVFIDFRGRSGGRLFDFGVEGWGLCSHVVANLVDGERTRTTWRRMTWKTDARRGSD